MYDNQEICSKCGGKCCKQMPGLFIPDDFEEITKDMLKNMVRSGCYVFDYEYNYNVDKEEDEILYCIRPSIKGEIGKIISSTYDSRNTAECFYLTENGCELSAEERPHECKMLEPKENYGCQYHGVNNKLEIVKLWINYVDLIKEIIEEIREERKGKTCMYIKL